MLSEAGATQGEAPGLFPQSNQKVPQQREEAPLRIREKHNMTDAIAVEDLRKRFAEVTA
jgi:hypothetical protein